MNDQTDTLPAPEPVRTVELSRRNLIRGGIIAGVALVLVVFVTRSPSSDSAASTPMVIGGPTTTVPDTVPPVDPLVNLGQLTPSANALVGQDFDARRELARRASEVMTNAGTDQCALLIGGTTGGAWELSVIYGPAHPIPLIAGCPFPPASTTTTTGA